MTNTNSQQHLPRTILPLVKKKKEKSINSARGQYNARVRKITSNWRESNGFNLHQRSSIGKKRNRRDTVPVLVSEVNVSERDQSTHTYAATIIDDFNSLRHYVACLCSLETTRIQIVWNKWKRLSWAKSRSHTELAYIIIENYKCHNSLWCAASAHEIRKSLVKTKHKI